MSERLDPAAAAPDAVKAMIALETYLRGCGLEAGLVHLVKLRASQINGCAYCIHMHAHEALTDGDTLDRLVLLDAWREASIYTPREQAALRWTEALTSITVGHASDADYEAARAEFSEAELVKLSVLIGTINAWNRLAIGMRRTPPVRLKPAA